MANIIYRTTSSSPSRVSSTVKNSPLTNAEIDGNFKVIDEELGLKSPLASPVFTGVPQVPTATAGTNNTQAASTAFVVAERGNTATLTAKTFNVTQNTLNGFPINSFVVTKNDGSVETAIIKAIPNGGVVGTTDIQILSGKTLQSPVISGTATGTIAGSIGFSAGSLYYGTGTQLRYIVTFDGIETLTNKTMSGASNTFTNIPNSALVNTTIGINGAFIPLGGYENILAANPNALTIGNGLLGGSYIGSSAVTISVDPAVTATLTNPQILTNKTLTSPIITELVVTLASSSSTARSRTYSVSGNGAVITLPSSPIIGDIIKILNGGNFTFTVARNGVNIMGLAEDLNVDIDNVGFQMTYISATRGWCFS